MFNEMSIVATAISSFNNAALFNPYFFAIGLLSLPLFYMVYLYGRDILEKLKWNKNIEEKTSFWSVLFLVLWLLIFGGNYAVMRDGISLLPVMIATVLFVSTVFITKQSIKLNYLGFLQNKKYRLIFVLMLIALCIFSAKPDFYGVLMQLSAVFSGIIVGSRFHKNMSDIFISVLIFSATITLVLMQPEFFRFGQLGNLTIIHLLWILLTGFFGITALVAKYTKSRGKIYNSAYIKLKWLFRIISALAFVLFALTESVPVFIGLMGALMATEILTIYHAKRINGNMFKQSFAMMLVCFGVLIICPIITCLGLIYMASLPENIKAKEFLDLL